MKMPRLSAGGGSALGGKKLILSAILAIAVSICSLAMKEALAAEINWALEGTPEFRGIEASNHGSWWGTAANINDDNPNSYIGGQSYGDFGVRAATYIQRDLTIDLIMTS